MNIIADKPVDPSQQRKSLIDTIRIPLVSVFPRKSKQDLAAQGGAAGLASMETLDDTDKSADKNEDDMKNVKLDSDVRYYIYLWLSLYLHVN